MTSFIEKFRSGSANPNAKAAELLEQEVEKCNLKNKRLEIENEELNHVVVQRPKYLKLFAIVGISWIGFIVFIILVNGCANTIGKTYIRENVMIELIRTLYFPPLLMGASYLFGAYRRK